MNEDDNIFFNSHIPLILDNEVNSNSDIPLILDNKVNSSLNTNHEILRINQLIKIKYLTNKKVCTLKRKIYI